MSRFALLLIALTLTTAACGGARAPVSASMAPLPLAAPVPLTQNHFKRDQSGNVSEHAMREILAAPVYLEAGARLGIVPVQTGYEPDRHVPINEVTGVLANTLADSGHFEVASEVTTDWPSATSIAGLRELATRYRAEYLLLYRHRFVEESYVNGWGWSWLTIVGGLAMPLNTNETAGVLEATLFDVKTGTLLFTVYERVSEEADHNMWNNDVKLRKMKQRLLAEATEKLSVQVMDKVTRLVAARPAESAEGHAVAGLPSAPPAPVHPQMPLATAP